MQMTVLCDGYFVRLRVQFQKSESFAPSCELCGRSVSPCSHL